MSHDRTNRATMTADEIASIREIVDKQGSKKAAALLGLQAVATLHKALAGLPVHSLTASTLRAKLAALH